MGAADAAAAAPRYLAIHVRPSKQPNCLFEKRDVGPSPGPLDLVRVRVRVRVEVSLVS